jgi:hypothetical protein
VQPGHRSHQTLPPAAVPPFSGEYVLLVGRSFRVLKTSLPRAKQKALGTEKNTRQRFLYQEPIGWLSAKNFFAKCNFLTLGKENLKNHFFASNFFLSSTYTYTKHMLKFGTISPLFAIFKKFTSF